jgi:hypothetical protein
VGWARGGGWWRGVRGRWAVGSVGSTPIGCPAPSLTMAPVTSASPSRCWSRLVTAIPTWTLPSKANSVWPTWTHSDPSADT